MTVTRKRAPREIDRIVGAKIKEMRVARGLSEAAFAARLGVSPSQLQKYERGDNRIAASRLHEAATVLDVGVDMFFPDQKAAIVHGPVASVSASTSATELFRALNEPDGQALVEAFNAIRDPALRARVLGVARAIAERY